MGRSKKKQINESLTADSSPNSECCLDLKIDIHSLRGKNMELVQHVAKLQQEKAILLKQNATLQKDYFSLNSKFVNLKNVLTSVDTTVKNGFPKLAEVVQSLAQVMHLCSVGAVVSNSNKDPKTQAVSPHTVNGTVIRNPTITLARFSDNNSPSLSGTTQRSPNATLTGSPNHSSNSSRNRQPNINIYENSMAGPSRRESINVHDTENSENNETTESNNENDSNEMIGHRRRKGVMPFMDSSDEECEEDQNNLLGASMESGEEFSGRLETIQEESERQYSSLNSNTDRVREIRIYLSPLHNESDKNDLTEIPEGSFSARTSLSGKSSRNVIENTFLNEIHPFPDNVSSYKNSHNSEIFTLDEEEIRKFNNNNANSFIFSPITDSLSPNVPEDSPGSSSNLNESHKYLTMLSLGLQPTINGQELATSTPRVTTPRKSSRIKNHTEKPLYSSVSPSKSNITKRKISKEKNVAQVFVKRLKFQISTHKKPPSPEAPPSPKKPENKTQQRVKNKGKENRKAQTSIQIKSSPRPKRAAQPTTLRELNLKKKLRRSK